MKPTELMIGDWVVNTQTNIKEKVLCICSLTVLLESREMYINVNNIEPITLTLEILERNGFELRNGFFYHRIDDKPHHYDFKLENGGVFSSEGYTLQCCIYHLTIRYVHEFQHALRICRLNELADNFRVEE